VTASERLPAGSLRFVRSLPFRLGAAAVLVAIAVLAAVLAHDVRSWRDTLRDDAGRYALSPGAQEQWTAATYLPAGLSARLLGVAPDRHWLSALRFFALAKAADLSQGITPATQRLLQTAEAALTRTVNDPDPARASQAYTLLSAILFKDSQSSYVPDVAIYAASLAAMQNAVRADPANEQARADLELLLRQFQADTSQATEAQANNQGSRRAGKTVGRGKGIPPVKAAGGDY
jgi:hypothetical protein